MSKFFTRINCINKSTKKITIDRRFLAESFRCSSDLVVNHRLVLDPSCEEKLNNGQKHKRHDGILTPKRVVLPGTLKDATFHLIEKYPVSDLKKKSADLVKYLWSRHVPVESDVIVQKAKELELQILSEEGARLAELSLEEREKLENKVKSKVVSKLRKQIYHWEPIKYDAFRSFLYLFGRLSFDYRAAYQVFYEISQRVVDFAPKTVFHFGSGLGTTIWACDSIWPKNISEHFCCDVSDDMNTLARLLLQGGREEEEMCIPGVSFRQFFPPSPKIKYDIVVSAFSLNELPSREERLKVIEALWKKTEKFLVVIENGTNAGFSLVDDTRDFILKLNQTALVEDGFHEDGFQEDGFQEDGITCQASGHVFSPCPHDKACPRKSREDGTPCNFEVSYEKLSQSNDQKEMEKERISYVVLRRGSREDIKTGSWPRVVRPVSTPSRCVHLRTCTSSGQLEYSVITAAKHGRGLYWCARACQWGDLLPSKAPDTVDSAASVDSPQRGRLAVEDVEPKRSTL